MSNQSTNSFTNEEEEEEYAPITRTASVAGWGSSSYPRDASGKVLYKGGRSCRRRRRASRRRASRRRASRRRRM